MVQLTPLSATCWGASESSALVDVTTLYASELVSAWLNGYLRKGSVSSASARPISGEVRQGELVHAQLIAASCTQQHWQPEQATGDTRRARTGR